MELHQSTIYTLHNKLCKGDISATDLVQSVLNQIERTQTDLNAYITINPEQALEQATTADNNFKQGMVRSPLQGIPIAIKDNICTKGLRTTCASQILENFVPPYDATVIQHLQTAGAIIIGKTNLDEFAMGSSTESSFFGVTRNPWGNLQFVPGGSSGGSAAAVAADACIAALGSDTGGSVRQPAALTGVVGLKPTYGRISRYGLVAFASSLDQIGPITKDVRDAACLLQVIAGHDPRDSTSGNLPVPNYQESLGRGVANLRLGIPREYFTEGIDSCVEQSVRAAIETLHSQGAELVEVSLPHTGYAVATYYILANAEASSNLARYDGVRYGSRVKQYDDLFNMYTGTRSAGFGLEVKRRIMLGTYALSAGYYDAYYQKAQQLRTLFRQDFTSVFQHCDALLTPVTPGPAFRLGERINDPLQMYLADIFTVPANLAGLPAISIPCGFTPQDLPVGLQIIAAPFQEETMLQIAAAFESATDFHTRKPDFSSASP